MNTLSKALTTLAIGAATFALAPAEASAGLDYKTIGGHACFTGGANDSVKGSFNYIYGDHSYAYSAVHCPLVREEASGATLRSVWLYVNKAKSGGSQYRLRSWQQSGSSGYVNTSSAVTKYGTGNHTVYFSGNNVSQWSYGWFGITANIENGDRLYGYVYSEDN